MRFPTPVTLPCFYQYRTAGHIQQVRACPQEGFAWWPRGNHGKHTGIQEQLPSPGVLSGADAADHPISAPHHPPPPRPHASQDPSPLAPHPLLKKKKPLDHSRFWSCLEKQGVCSHGFCPGCPTAPALHGIDGGGWGEGGDGRMGEEPGAGAGPSWEPRTLFLSCSFGS